MKQGKMSLKIAPAEMMPEAVEVMPEDGQTENLPEPQLDAMTEESAAVGLPDFSPTMTTNEGFYSRDEFRQNFNSFLEFLENPATATDAFSTIVGRGGICLLIKFIIWQSAITGLSGLLIEKRKP